jgi:hypothetical protein
MMDYTVASKEMTAEYGEKLTWEVPADRHLFIEAPWPEEACHSARSLFAYPAEGVGERIAACDWPNLKLLLIHNSDTSVPHSALECLLDKYPALTIWLVNNKGPAHPRIKTVPLFEQNRRWRGGTADYTPPITLCRGAERSVGIFVPPCATTNPIRPIWLAAARKMRQRLDLEVSIGRMSPEDFYEKMEDSVTVLCPPGNGADTHRHWETLVKGAWPIVQRNEHTERLLDEYPSLPLIAIEDIEELRTLELPREVPCPFHPMLLREYWRVLFRSYVGGF